MANSPKVLVTGGAGYIGSHAILALRERGIPLVVLDNLSTGNRWAVPADLPFVEGDVGDQETVAAILESHNISAVMHFAGSVIVPESVSDPLKYYRNNTANSRTLIQACVDCGVSHFLFSSTAAVYGMPESIPVAESAPTVPINPYGSSKLMTEVMLHDAAAAYGLKFAALRYFNVAGADPEGRTGQATKQATHLIKVAAETALGKRREMQIFGDDYATPDGTCIRDYIHVSDLADAHALVLERLMGGSENLVLNCGYGHGFSVKEVLAALEQVTSHALPVSIGPRRAGDPPELVSANARIMQETAWRPQRDDLEVIVRSALDWERKLASLQADQRAMT